MGDLQSIAADSFVSIPFRNCWIARGHFARDGFLTVMGGRIKGITARRPRNATLRELPGDTLMPGLVNAHAHLRYSHLKGQLPRTRQFTSWIASILGAPQPKPADLEQGAREMARDGIVALGDHDTDGTSAAVLRRAGFAGVVYREFAVFDPSDGRVAARAAARAARTALETAAASLRLRPGLAPHATYTVAQEAFSVRTGLPVSLHFLETEEERQFMEYGTGPMDRLLRMRGRRPPFEPPLCPPLEFLGRSVHPLNRTSLIHANALSKREVAAAASAGSTFVHCPGTHAYFRRGDTPLRDWYKAGAAIALGTDSLASNSRLSLLHEMALLYKSDPWLDASEIIEFATLGGARALSLKRYGTLEPGASAHIVALTTGVGRHGTTKQAAAEVEQALVHRPSVEAVLHPSNSMASKHGSF